MKDFYHSIDRFLSTCKFCLNDNVRNISHLLIDTDNYYPNNSFYFPNHFKIISADDALKPYFRDTLDSNYNFFLIDLNYDNIYCITSELADYLNVFKAPVKKEQLASINKSIFHQKLFEALLNYGFIHEKLENDKHNNNLSDIQNTYKSTGFHILRKISESPNNVVYLAMYKNKKCILKQALCLDEKDLLVNKINIINKLGSNPYMPQVIFYNQESLFYAIEYVEGIVWNKYLKVDRNLEEKINGVKGIIDAVAFLHSHGIIHGDIHQSQFIVEDNGMIKIIDFDMISDLNNQNEDELIGGALEYLSPEIIKENPLQCIDRTVKNTMQSEIYRLGVLIYISFYGFPPYYEMTWRKMYKAILNDSITFDPIDYLGNKIPQVYINIMKGCLEKKAKDRFDSAVQIKAMLRTD